MDMDWGKEVPQGLEVYPEGTYKVMILDYKRVPASTGTPQIRWRAKILEPAEFEGKTILDHTALTEKSLWRVAWLVSACGIEVEKLGKMAVNSAAFEQVLENCKGRTIYWHLTVGIAPNGHERNTIDDYKRDDQQPPVEFIKQEDVPDFLKEE